MHASTAPYSGSASLVQDGEVRPRDPPIARGTVVNKVSTTMFEVMLDIPSILCLFVFGSFALGIVARNVRYGVCCYSP
jgi:hypothetical protein